MSLSDEETIVATTYDSGTKHETLKRGNIKVTTINKEETGIEESHLSVFLEVTGSGYRTERPGMDIVTVLDVGESMKGEKLETLKGVMRLLIDKLSSADRLSIVTVSKDPQKLCGLRQMSLVSQAEKLVSGLETQLGKDVNGGLDLAFKVINDRKYAAGRRVAILLMSDGEQFEGPIKHTFFETIPVYTFGFGDNLDSMVLNDVAKSSDGGIHCSIDVTSSSPSNLRSAVAECFAKLFTVVVSDLQLTVKRAKSTAAKIDNICVGTYSRSFIPFTALEDNVIVSFGDLYANETCKVEVDLHLSRVISQQPCDLLHFSYSWRTMGEVFNSSSRLVRVNRVANLIKEGGSEQEKGETGLRDVDLTKFQGLSEFLKGLWLQLNNISSCIYKLLIPPFLVVLSLLSTRTQDMLKSLTMVWIRFRESMKSEAGGNHKVPAKKNDLSQAAAIKRLGSHVIGVSFRMSKYLFPLLVIFLILYGVSKQVGFKSPIEREVEQRDVPQVIIKYIQYPVTDLRAYYCNSHVEILSDHLTKALDSVTILRDILSNYMEQSSDLVRSENIKALGEHIQMTFEWSKAIKKVLQNAESIPLYVKNWEAGIIDENPVKDESSNKRKYLACLLLLLTSLVGMRLNKLSVRSLQGCLTHVSTSIKVVAKSLLWPKKIDPASLTAKLVEDMSNHIQKTLHSVQIIRGILSDYVKLHTEFEDNNNNSKDSVRSRNVKALSDYIHKAFNSVEAIEDILKQST